MHQSFQHTHVQVNSCIKLGLGGKLRLTIQIIAIMRYGIDQSQTRNESLVDISCKGMLNYETVSCPILVPNISQ